MNCLLHLPSQEKLDKHKPDCKRVNDKQSLEIPNMNNKFISFNHIQNTLDVPFIIYADLESLLIPLKDNTDDDDDKSYTKKTHDHEACSFAYKVVCSYDDKLSKPIQLYRGKNPIDRFFKAIFE